MKTNDLRYKANKQTSKENIFVSIRLNDECKNGHQDFSITANIYEAGKPTTDRYMISGGCCHDDILKHFPEFKIFVNLHLSDAKGVPMYAVENGFSHLKEGFNSKSTGEQFKAEFCQYYRMTPEQFDVIEKSENKLEYALLLRDLGILTQWEAEANEAIKILEELTGNEFENDSKKSQYHAPEADQIKDFEEKRAAGYFTPGQKETRAIEKRKADKEKRLKDISDYCENKVTELRKEKTVKIWLLNRFDKLNGKKGFSLDFTFDNFIYYNHSTELSFNWRDYGKQKEMTREEFKMLCDSLNQADLETLPANIKFTLKGVESFTNK